MNQDTFTTMLKDGRNIAALLQSVQKDKRVLMRALADAFIDGMIAQERLTSQTDGPVRDTGQSSA